MEQREGWGGETGAAGNSTERSQAERDRVRVEFYATYDVMTGVRIAATLGGFFALMVFLIVYKSRSKSVKALNDPKIVELAEAVVAEEQAVEEERQLTIALEEALSQRARSRPSIGEEPLGPRRSRFLSYGGGYGSLLTPPRRLSTLRGDSLPGSALRMAERRVSAACARDRRLSSATCSSSGSSYLERRGSSVVCSLPDRRLSTCPSRRLAPLASVGSVGPSFALDGDLASVGPDSVFAEDEDSTDDEVEQFSTDSGGGECTELASRPVPPRPPNISLSRETLF